MTNKVLVTSALPYANGPIHLGHLVEYIQTDIWVRFLKMMGRDAIYICADDAHGTAIEIKANAEGITPEKLIARFRKEHYEDFLKFSINFDFYGTTHCEENRKWSETLYRAQQRGGHIVSKKIEQTYCSTCKRFLPDRYVKGSCPNCGAEDQYGDSCEICNSTYNPTDLNNAKCSICGSTPARKSSTHEFVRLSDFSDILKEWLANPEHISEGVRRFITQWLKEGLKDWDIMRDSPYFGFPVPGHKDKYFYVWLDAPIGYISNSERWCAQHNRDIKNDYWCNPDTEIYHFIGKDIIYFHTLFWPAMLYAEGLNMPTAVYVHGFLTVEGKKMSKSRGTFITAKTYLEYLDPQYLRYYYASKLADNIDDIDLSLKDFENRVNSELVNKIANLASRAVSFVSKRFAGKLSTVDDTGLALIKKAREAKSEIADLYRSRNYAAAIERICRLADSANLYFQENAPWALIKENPESANRVCTAGVNISRILAIYLQPVLPDYAEKIRSMLNEKDDQYAWSDVDKLLENRDISPFTRLVEKIEEKKLKQMIEASKEIEEKKEEGPKVPGIEDIIDIKKFIQVDIRAARIAEAELVPDSKKLLKLKIDLGSLGQRTVFAGIKASFPEPGKLVGKTVAVIANLEPRKMKFGTSEGMILAAGKDDAHLSLLELDPSVPPGQRVT